MGTTFIGKSSAAKGRERVYSYQNSTAGLLEGAVVMFDGSKNGNLVKAPTKTAETGVAGVICNVVKPGGTTANLDVDVQKDGIANVLLSAGEAVVGGSPLITKGTDGSVMAFAKATHKDCDIIGYSEVTRTAGATNELIPVSLQIVHVGDQS